MPEEAASDYFHRARAAQGPLSNQHILLKDNLKWIGWQVDLKVVRHDESNRNATSSGIV